MENGNNHAGGEGAVSELDRGTDDGEILRRIRRGRREEENIALCWTGVVGSIAEEKETDTQLTKEFEALARSGSHASGSSGSNNTAALLFNDDSSASKFHARPKLSVSNAALAMMRGGRAAVKVGRILGLCDEIKGWTWRRR